jgi:hypothetical protein
VADQPNAVEDHTLQLQLELRLGRQPISGRLRTQQGVEEAFEGWLGFADALRRLHEQPAMTEQEPNRRPRSKTPDSASTQPEEAR